ncbi:MAG TPA: hypothetical protein VGC97_20565 [Pyrinomonadaceae bacterium]|jgi:hypothetical protein
MESQIDEQTTNSFLENIVPISMLLSSLFIYAFVSPSLKIGLFILFLLSGSYLLIFKFVFDECKKLLEPENIEIKLKAVIIISFAFLMLLPFLPIIIPIWAIVNSSKTIFQDSIPLGYKFLKITAFLYSTKTQKEVFESIACDWNEEIFNALKKNKDANLFMINARNTYAFLAAMWQKSPIGDLIEFVVKIAKQ